MKIVLCCSLFFVGAISFCGAQEAPPPEKRALIIAVGKYDLKPTKTGWWDLSSKDDAKLLYKTLLIIGFKPENIDTLINEKATKAGVLKALDDLEKKANPSDIVMVHYSGHGQQLPDNNADEEDRMDECLVLYGAINPNKYSNPQFNGYLRDDEFGEALEKIRLKVGEAGHLMVIMDSCHSGSGTRDLGDEVVRGDMPYSSRDQIPTVPENNEVGFGVAHSEKKYSEKGGKMIFISAAYANQRATQIKDEGGLKYGALTYAFSKSILTKSKNKTYQSLFASILVIIKSRNLEQTPTMEGEVDFEIFSGNYLKQEPYFEINRIANDSILIIKGGNLLGIYKDTEFAIVKAGERNANAEIFAKGKVTKADNFEAEVTLNTKFPFKHETEAWCYVTRQSFDSKKMIVDLSKLKDKALREELSKRIQSTNSLEVKKGGPISVELTGGKLAIRSRTLDRIIRKITVGKNDSLVNYLTRYAQASFLKRTTLNHENYNVTLKVIPVETENDQPLREVELEGFYRNNNLVFETGQQVILEVKNNTDYPTYFNILYFAESGEIQVMVPCTINKTYCDENPSSFYLKPLETKKINCVLITLLGTGANMFKVVATDQPANLCQAFKRRGGERSFNNAFEEVFSGVLNGNANIGFNSRAPGDTKATTTDFVFSVVTKKNNP